MTSFFVLDANKFCAFTIVCMSVSYTHVLCSITLMSVHLCWIGGRLVPKSPAFLVCTLMLFKMRLIPSSSALSIFWWAARLLLRPDIGGCEPEPRPWWVLIAPGFLPPMFGVVTEGAATFRFCVEKNGCNCLSKTKTSVTLSSFGSSSMGVSFSFSTLRCKSLSGCKMLGVSCRMSSRNSVRSKAALLYFCLD